MLGSTPGGFDIIADVVSRPVAALTGAFRAALTSGYAG